MLNDFDIGQCPTCSNSIRCDTWAEWKCTVHKRRYIHNGPVNCPDFKKRPAKWEEMRCGCEDCQKNETLMEGRDDVREEN